MSDFTPSTIRRLLSRSNSSRHSNGLHSSNAVVRPETISGEKQTASASNGKQTVSVEFLTGYDLLRVTRKKARTRRFTIEPESGAVFIDDTAKFSVDAIRDIRVGAEAGHYRELCKISSEHEPRWLSIVYYLETNKLKVLHVICPSTQIVEHFQASLTRLYQKRARFLGAGNSLFGPGQMSINEDIWQSLMPVVNGQAKGCTKAKSPEAMNEPDTMPLEKSPRMSFGEVESLCHRLYFNAPRSYLLGLFEQADEQRTGYLDFPAFKKFVEVLKVRHDVIAIYTRHKADKVGEMTREEFIRFLKDVQGLREPPDALDRVFNRASEQTDGCRTDVISSANFTAYLLSRHNSLISPTSSDMSLPLNEYFISSSHNTYLTGRQIGDESSVEPYIRVLQKGCRCIEIDIWANSEGFPEVRHGRTFTSSVSLEAVLKAIDKYAFIVSPWPLIISLEIRCGPKSQLIVAEMLLQVFGEVLLTVKEESKAVSSLPSPEDLRHRILLKVKSSTNTEPDLMQYDQSALFSSGSRGQHLDRSSLEESLPSTMDESPVSTAPESDADSRAKTSRSSSISSRSSSYSSNVSNHYRPFSKSRTVVPELVHLAPYCKAIKFRNFSLPESKSFNHIFSLSERTIKQFSRETSIQVSKHNTRYLMRVYPSQTRLMSSNFLPHHFWQQGVQMAALNWQTHDLGMKINDAFFASDDHSADVTGYLLKPKHMRTWSKGQEMIMRRWPRTKWSVEIISGTQLPKGQGACGKVSPLVEMEVVRPVSSSSLALGALPAKVADKDRESKFKTQAVENNGFNPAFGSKFTFICAEDEDTFFTLIRFVVKDGPSGDVLGQSTVPISRLQKGYRSVPLYDLNGERFIFSALLVKITVR